MTIDSAPAFEAEVQVGAATTRYLCSGRGTPVLLVAARDDDRDRLLAWLAPHYRVAAPLPSVRTPDWPADWVTGVMEGLGLDGRPVVLCPGFAVHAQQLADRLAATGADVVIDTGAGAEALLVALAAAGTRGTQGLQRED